MPGRRRRPGAPEDVVPGREPGQDVGLLSGFLVVPGLDGRDDLVHAGDLRAPAKPALYESDHRDCPLRANVAESVQKTNRSGADPTDLIKLLALAAAASLAGNVEFARKLSDEAQRAKQELEDALGRAHTPDGARRWQEVWNNLPKRIRDELRGKVSRPSKRGGRGPGF